MPMEASGRHSHLTCGQESTCVVDLEDSLHRSQDDGFDFVVSPLSHPRYQRDFTGKFPTSSEPFTRSDLLLSSYQWSQWTVGKVSVFSGFDSPNYTVRTNAQKVLQQELDWATHLSLQAVLLPPPSYNCAGYAMALSSHLRHTSFMQFWVRVPLVSLEHIHQDEDTRRVEGDSWECWNRLFAFTDYSANLLPALELTGDIPDEDVIKRWLGEPLRTVIVPTSIFLTNKQGFPVLSKRHQALVMKLFQFKLQWIISGNAKHKDSVKVYLQYLRYLYTRRPPLTEQQAFESPFYDYLQAPLQPLKDNLESQTYETFEKDPVKYVRYEEAVRLALMDRAKEGETQVVMVVGAGRGPLVRASLRASESCKRPIRVYAVEKNPNAIVTLRNMKISLGWGDQVTIVDSDMRWWNAPEKADILVSELLGSWGDNELSPECLDGAQKYLKEDGVSIPTDYTSYVAPISTPRLWNGVRSFGTLKDFETPYVVKIHNAHELSAIQECFYFQHPNNSVPIDNQRYRMLSFPISINSMVHGFAGYFHATLYKHVNISIHPDTYSDGMFSWFPLFIPLRVPVRVEAGQNLEAHFWRREGNGKVWYEWCVSQPSALPIHNPGGRSYWIGL